MPAPENAQPDPDERAVKLLIGWVVCGFVIGVIFLFGIVMSGTL